MQIKIEIEGQGIIRKRGRSRQISRDKTKDLHSKTNKLAEVIVCKAFSKICKELLEGIKFVKGRIKEYWLILKGDSTSFQTRLLSITIL